MIKYINILFMLYTLKNNEIWQRVEEVQKEKNMTNQQLKNKLGIYDQKWEMWKERGIPAAHHYSFAKCLGVYMEWLVVGDGIKYKNAGDEINEQHSNYEITARNDGEKRALRIYRSIADFQQRDWLAEGQEKVDLYNKFNKAIRNEEET